MRRIIGRGLRRSSGRGSRGLRGLVRVVMLAVVIPVICQRAGTVVCAQEQVTLRSDLLLYGDNTEFRNPFREGDTLFGAAVRVAFDVELNAKASVRLGAFGHQRFGSDKAFERARPVIALTVRGRRSSFVFGTLPALAPSGPAGLSRASVSESGGPDRGGPHGLLPPLQRETLAFDRPVPKPACSGISTARVSGIRCGSSGSG